MHVSVTPPISLWIQDQEVKDQPFKGDQHLNTLAVWPRAVPLLEPGSSQENICCKYWFCSYRHKHPMSLVAAQFADVQRSNLSREQNKFTEPKKINLIFWIHLRSATCYWKPLTPSLARARGRYLEQKGYELFRCFYWDGSTRWKHAIPQKPWSALMYNGRTIPMRRP